MTPCQLAQACQNGVRGAVRGGWKFRDLDGARSVDFKEIREGSANVNSEDEAHDSALALERNLLLYSTTASSVRPSLLHATWEKTLIRGSLPVVSEVK